MRFEMLPWCAFARAMFACAFSPSAFRFSPLTFADYAAIDGFAAYCFRPDCRLLRRCADADITPIIFAIRRRFAAAFRFSPFSAATPSFHCRFAMPLITASRRPAKSQLRFFRWPLLPHADYAFAISRHVTLFAVFR
jgi:hypothetical protein